MAKTILPRIVFPFVAGLLVLVAGCGGSGWG
jgi:hypothetical protein